MHEDMGICNDMRTLPPLTTRKQSKICCAEPEARISPPSSSQSSASSPARPRGSTTFCSNRRTEVGLMASESPTPLLKPAVCYSLGLEQS